MEVFVPHDFKLNHIQAPASKSVAQRMLFAAALGQKSVELNHLGYCDDVKHIQSVVEQLGAEVIKNGDNIIIHPNKKSPKSELNCGESGLGIRLTTSIASTFSEEFKIFAEGSLLNRPLTQFADFLPKMGVDINFSKGNKPPLTVKGPLKAGKYTVDGSLSSQYISGILMALPLVDGDSILHVLSPKSTPYIDITLNVLKTFGIDIKASKDYTQFDIKGNQKYELKNDQIAIEGDYSGAAFWVVYALLTEGEFKIDWLKKDSTQADKAILDVVNLCGGDYSWSENQLIIHQKASKPFHFDATHCPDLFPILTVLAAGIKGESRIKGVHRLKHKESDRATVLVKEFSPLGLSIDIEGDELVIQGTAHLQSGTVDSHNDHRIAMAGAIAAILTPDGIQIKQAESVNKSYPEFWNLLDLKQ